MNWAELGTISGAIIAIIALLWNIFEYRAKRPRLLVEYYMGIMLFEGKNLPAFLIKVSNRTQHRLIINGVGVRFKRGALHSMGQGDLPKELLSGDSHMVFMDVYSLAEILRNNGKARYIWAKDATGREFRGNAKGLGINVRATIKIADNQKTAN